MFHRGQCCLGPLLFLFYFDGITGVSLSLAGSIYTQKFYFYIYRIIYIDKVADWIGENDLTLNISKCKAMVISHKRIHSVLEKGLYLDGQPLEQVEEFDS